MRPHGIKNEKHEIRKNNALVGITGDIQGTVCVAPLLHRTEEGGGTVGSPRGAPVFSGGVLFALARFRGVAVPARSGPNHNRFPQGGCLNFVHGGGGGGLSVDRPSRRSDETCRM